MARRPGVRGHDDLLPRATSAPGGVEETARGERRSPGGRVGQWLDRLQRRRESGRAYATSRARALTFNGGHAFETQVVDVAIVPSSWRALSVGGATTCGVRVDESGWCWSERLGQVGDGSVMQRHSPVQLAGSWQGLSSADTATCGVKSDHTGWCWGYNPWGQLGDGTFVSRASPVQVPGEWQSLTTDGSTSCGVQTDQTGWCWGSNGAGQVGDGTTSNQSQPVQLPGLWDTLIAGTTTCGIQIDDTGWCWGLGPIGDGTSTSRLTPYQLPGSWRAIRSDGGTKVRSPIGRVRLVLGDQQRGPGR